MLSDPDNVRPLSKHVDLIFQTVFSIKTLFCVCVCVCVCVCIVWMT